MCVCGSFVAEREGGREEERERERERENDEVWLIVERVAVNAILVLGIAVVVAGVLGIGDVL